MIAIARASAPAAVPVLAAIATACVGLPPLVQA